MTGGVPKKRRTGLRLNSPPLDEHGNSAHTASAALLIALGLVALDLIVYWQVWGHDFIPSWDDAVYVTNNGPVLAGLTWSGVKWAFTTNYATNWHPITWLSHMLDVNLFGLQAGGHHLTSLLFHVANTLLIFGLLNRMTGALGRSAFVAALFGVHPLHVESVAWVAERKDVLSAMFWWLTIWAYVAYTYRPHWHRFALVMLALALGLMAKPMLVTMPLILLLLDIWPLRRANIIGSRQSAVGSRQSAVGSRQSAVSSWRNCRSSA